MDIQTNISLRPFNSFGIDVLAKAFSVFHSAEELAEILEDAENKTLAEKLVLGGGSNILLTKNFDGLVLKNEMPGTFLVDTDAEHYYVKVGAGENWHRFVMHCVDQNYAGIENLALIPGNVGASPMQNIGAYGVEIKDVFYQLEAYHIKDRRVDVFTKDDCKFGYRESVFKSLLKNQYVILSVTFKLLRNPVFNTAYGAIMAELDEMKITDLTIHSIARAVIRIRQSKLPDPSVIGNAGSFFKNPEIDTDQFRELKIRFPEIIGYDLPGHRVKLAAGWMIEQCGWKGYREGDAGCHAQQALVLVNYGNAKGEEILTLSNKIISSVKNRFGVTLEKEVNIY
jgi:UDP-N-acetylmuramate dehydrogenase